MGEFDDLLKFCNQAGERVKACEERVREMHDGVFGADIFQGLPTYDTLDLTKYNGDIDLVYER